MGLLKAEEIAIEACTVARDIQLFDLLVEDMEASVDRIVRTLSPFHTVDVNADPQEALFAAAENDYDLVLASSTIATEVM